MLLAALAVAGCVCSDGPRSRRALPGDDPLDPNIDPAPPPPTRELAQWDFASQASEPSLLSLWPQDTAAPQRRKRQMRTRQDGADLIAETDGPDPYFIWMFERPLHAAVLSVEVDSERPGLLQAFWTTVECKSFQESCSGTERIGIGTHVVDFVLSFGKAVRGLRLDLPAEVGTKLRVRRIRLLAKARFSTLPAPHEGHTTLSTITGGLRVSCQEPDPWVTFPTPWLKTERARAVEVEMIAPEGVKPQLFWQGTACPNFAEQCSVVLSRVAGTPHTFRADLTGVPNWRGLAAHLRFDPDPGAGDFIMQRLSLIRAPGAS